MGHWGSLAVSNVLLCLHRLSGLVSKGWVREKRGLTLYTLPSRLQKRKARFNPYMVACNSIGYFSPSATWPSSCFNSLSFISLLCCPFPLLHYQNTNLSISFFFFFSSPPYYNKAVLLLYIHLLGGLSNEVIFGESPKDSKGVSCAKSDWIFGYIYHVWIEWLDIRWELEGQDVNLRNFSIQPYLKFRT
jgi:hypothetical protein